MKTSKKSLIASIAVLCVCALSLSTATFAWFTASETAKLEKVDFTVLAQSDIKIGAISAVTGDSQHTGWVTTLKEENFTETTNDIEDEVHDMIPASATVDGSFKEPNDRENDVAVDTGKLADGAVMKDAQSGWVDFTVYVRTTKQQAVNMKFYDFVYEKTANDGVANAAEALRLGVGSTTNILSADGTVTLFENGVGLTAFDNGEGYYGSVTLYVWMDGNDPACKNANALSSKDYSFKLDFAYAD